MLIDRFILRHWRGEYSLAVAYWLIGAFVSVISVGIALFTKNLALDIPYDPVVIFALSVATWCALAMLLVWHLIGTWRSATWSNPQRRLFTWANLAKLMLILGALQFGRTIARIAIPQTMAIYDIAFNGDRDIPDYRLALAENGTEIAIQGGLKYGLARDLAALLAKSPAVRVISFQSPGGRIGEAEKLFHLIADHGLATVTNSYCLSACTLAFAGGADRWLGANAKLGYHAGHFVAATQAQLRDAESRIVDAAMARNGTPPAFYAKVDAVSPEKMWYPTRDELLANHLITERLSRAPSSLHAITASLLKASRKLNAGLPRRIDKFTTLVSSRVAGSDFTYHYEIDMAPGTRLDREKFSRLIAARLTASVCGNPALAADIANGVTYSYEYTEGAQTPPIYRLDLSSCPK